MAVESAQVSVGTTATQLTSAVNTAQRGAIVVYNRGTAAIFVGGAGVTTATGFQLDAGQAVSLDVDTAAGGDALYGIVATGTQAAHVLRAGR